MDFLMVTILLVDDSKTIQKAAELALTKNQYDLHLATADDVSQALEKAAQLKPEAILIDHNLPQQNGYALATELKKNPSLRHIPIMLLVGPQVALDPQKAMSIGISGAISKPFTAEDFNHALLSVLSSPVPVPDQITEPVPVPITETLVESKPEADPILEPAPPTEVIVPAQVPDSVPAIAAETIKEDEQAPPQLLNPPIAEQLNRSEIEQMIRKVIEEVVWEVVPDLAESIIKEELNRLLKK